MNRSFFLQVFLGLVVLFANLAVADDAEIKLLISDADKGAAKQEFKLSVKAPAERRVCFFDTNDGLLDAKGLIIRARLDQKENSKGELESDLVVKLRGNEPPAGYDELNAEADWVGPNAPRDVKRSFSIKEESVPSGKLKEIFSGDVPILLALTGKQRQFAEAVFGKDGGGVPWDQLRCVGPMGTWKSKIKLGDFEKVTVEYWRLEGMEDCLELIELSIKIEKASEDDIKKQAKDFYDAARSKDFVPSGQSKTARVLDFFNRLDKIQKRTSRKD